MNAVVKKMLRLADPLLVERPLVSVITATYGRPELLAGRAIPSVLAQTYDNFEMIIVGDHCEDNTEELIGAFKDKRIRFYNLSAHSLLPDHPLDRWRVIGAGPNNFGMASAKGAWLTHLDDDDEFTSDHIEVLLRAALRGGCDFVHGDVYKEQRPGRWRRRGGSLPKNGRVYNNSVLYDRKFAGIRFDEEAWRRKTIADRDRWGKLLKLANKVGYVNRVVGRYYLGRTSLARDLGVKDLDDLHASIKKALSEYSMEHGGRAGS